MPVNLYKINKERLQHFKNKHKLSKATNILVTLTFILSFLIFSKLIAQAEPIAKLVNSTNSQFNKDSTEIRRDLYFNGENPKYELYKVKDDLKLDNKDIIINSPDDLKIGSYYKVYNFPTKLILRKFLLGYKLRSLVPHLNFYWEVPVYAKNNKGYYVPVSSYSVVKNKLDGKRWHISSYGGLIGPYYADISSNPEKVGNILRKINLSDGDYFAHFNLPDSFDFYYVIKGGKEYFVPIYKGETNNYGLKSDYPYNRSVFVSHIKPIFSDDGNSSIPANNKRSTGILKLPYPFLLTEFIAFAIISYGIVKLISMKQQTV